MRFIVDLYRYVILAFCGIITIAAALLVFAALDPASPLRATEATPYALLAVFGLIILLILSLGAIATLISIHDRHAEIANAARDGALALERIAYQLSQQGEG